MAIGEWRPKWSPIMGFVGENGSGKSAMAVTVTLEKARMTGLPVYSNIELFSDDVDVRTVESLRDVLHIEHALVLWDEVSAVAPARGTQDNAPELVLRLSQLRHFSATLVWTSPVLEDVDVLIRRVTKAVVEMGSKWRKADPDPNEPWPRTVWAYGKQYDTAPVATVSINSDTKRTGGGFVKMSKLALDSYNTREHIDLRADHAVCLECGLKKRREYCKGNHVEKVNAGATTPPATATPDNDRTTRPSSQPRSTGNRPGAVSAGRPSAVVSDVGGLDREQRSTDTDAPQDGQKTAPPSQGAHVSS